MRAYLSAKTVFTKAQARIVPMAPNRTAVTAVASFWPLDCTKATTTAARLATQARTTQVSVERERLSSSASRLVSSAFCGQPIDHTHVRAQPEATSQPANGDRVGDHNNPIRMPATTPAARHASARRALRMRPDARRVRFALLVLMGGLATAGHVLGDLVRPSDASRCSRPGRTDDD